MARLNLWVTGLILLLCLGLAPLRVRAQAEVGQAVITSPLEGSVVSGWGPVLGTATHPQFQRYELAFAYDPNPTNAWFSIGEAAPTQVVNDVLGQWDTTNIADGLYQLRLRVYWSDRDYTEMLVRRVRIQNAPPTPAANPATAVPAATATPAPVLPVVTSTAARPVIDLPPTSTPRPTAGAAVGARPGSNPALPFNLDTLQAAFVGGVQLTLVAFAVLGAYAGLRAVLRYRSRR